MFDDRWVLAHLSRIGGPTCCVWRIPSQGHGTGRAASPFTGTARAILTASELFAWREPTVTHATFVQLSGIDGLRFRLAPGAISVHQEVIAFPEHFSFVYKDFKATGQQDPGMRVNLVEKWLKINARLRTIYPAEFSIGWYM